MTVGALGQRTSTAGGYYSDAFTRSTLSWSLETGPEANVVVVLLTGDLLLRSWILWPGGVTAPTGPLLFGPAS